MASDARLAIYYAPLPNDPLTARAARWLGRDPVTGAGIPQPTAADLGCRPSTSLPRPAPQLAGGRPSRLFPSVSRRDLARPATAQGVVDGPSPATAMGGEPSHPGARPSPKQAPADGADSRPATATLAAAQIEEITAEPRRYGFHATLKPPMRLAPGRSWAELMTAVRALAATITPFDLPRVAVHDLSGFLALRETVPCPALQALADTCVVQLDGFRAAPSEADLARRRGARLSPEQDAMLRRWGYPYVFGTWFFHMTLTRRLSDVEKAIFLPVTDAWFAPVLDVPRRVTDLCVFTQAGPEAPFQIAERVKLRG